jgi:VEFS-Box of polycomb protein
VSESEKKFLKLWNGFIQSHTLISDFSIPGRCMDFVRAYANDLNANDLRQDLTLHLYNLWDNGLVSSSHIVECMIEYDSLTRGECSK